MPKSKSTRVTVPEGQVAVLLPAQLAHELKGVLHQIRLSHTSRHLDTQTIKLNNAQIVQSIASDVLLCVLDSEARS